ncbi:hypothetical protein ARAM_000248, partial [Aspergillus rambellii]
FLSKSKSSPSPPRPPSHPSALLFTNEHPYRYLFIICSPLKPKQSKEQNVRPCLLHRSLLRPVRRPVHPRRAKGSQGIDVDALKAAVEAVLAGGDDATVADASQAAALKAGFVFATELVKMLNSEPGNDDKLKLYAFFKKSRNETPAQPSFYQIESKYKYNAWKEIEHISEQRAQAQYIKKVNDLIESIGTQ